MELCGREIFFLNMSAGSVFVRISLDAKDVATREKTVFHIGFGGVSLLSPMLSYAGKILDTCLAYRSCPEFLKFPRHRLLYPFPAHSVPLLNGTPSRVGGVNPAPRKTVTGQVLVSCTFKAAPATWPVASVSGGTPATAMGVSTHSTYDAESDYGTERPIPFMHWLQVHP